VEQTVSPSQHEGCLLMDTSSQRAKRELPVSMPCPDWVGNHRITECEALPCPTIKYNLKHLLMDQPLGVNPQILMEAVSKEVSNASF